ncbi:nucleotidyltransferase substrate binding protein [Geomonas sp.]|uniref:nucleotidyltransferase substrate binding protein n=1 Tax=Geomonas sp. TaxID=2651584 RepID=UPI002B468DAF|nr:nucleotidyltransferase substrate binding protein [Geomonas sp.]HJV35040.1 nucleotidyltransferase substrate binding protein [Geomonas sp.]
MESQDIRWQQRLAHFEKALAQLRKGVELSRQRALSEIEQQGLIKAFEFTHELAWNVLKDFFEYQGNVSIMGSRDATREAFQRGLITAGEEWMEMIKSRNMTSHTYNQEVADEISEKILDSYFLLLEGLCSTMQELKNGG